jgi:hypothetical protein
MCLLSRVVRWSQCALSEVEDVKNGIPGHFVFYLHLGYQIWHVFKKQICTRERLGLHVQ